VNHPDASNRKMMAASASHVFTVVSSAAQIDNAVMEKPAI
jgi:hypothetical protein